MGFGAHPPLCASPCAGGVVSLIPPSSRPSPSPACCIGPSTSMGCAVPSTARTASVAPGVGGAVDTAPCCATPPCSTATPTTGWRFFGGRPLRFPLAVRVPLVSEGGPALLGVCPAAVVVVVDLAAAVRAACSAFSASSCSFSNTGLTGPNLVILGHIACVNHICKGEGRVWKNVGYMRINTCFPNVCMCAMRHCATCTAQHTHTNHHIYNPPNKTHTSSYAQNTHLEFLFSLPRILNRLLCPRHHPHRLFHHRVQLLQRVPLQQHRPLQHIHPPQVWSMLCTHHGLAVWQYYSGEVQVTLAHITVNVFGVQQVVVLGAGCTTLAGHAHGGDGGTWGVGVGCIGMWWVEKGVCMVWGGIKWHMHGYHYLIASYPTNTHTHTITYTNTITLPHNKPSPPPPPPPHTSHTYMSQAPQPSSAAPLRCAGPTLL